MSFDWKKYNGFTQANIRFRSGEEIIREKERKHLREMMGSTPPDKSSGTNRWGLVNIFAEAHAKEVAKVDLEIKKMILGQTHIHPLPWGSHDEEYRHFNNREYQGQFFDPKKLEELIVLPPMKFRMSVRSFFDSPHFGEIGYISNIFEDGGFLVTFDDGNIYTHCEDYWCRNYFPIHTDWILSPKPGMYLKFKSLSDGQIYEGTMERGVSRRRGVRDYIAIKGSGTHRFTEENFESRWLVDIWPSRLRGK